MKERCKDKMSNVQNVFLVGAKSLGAYGGYETFVYKLTEYHQNNPNIKYHVGLLCYFIARPFIKKKIYGRVNRWA